MRHHPHGHIYIPTPVNSMDFLPHETTFSYTVSSNLKEYSHRRSTTLPVHPINPVPDSILPPTVAAKLVLGGQDTPPANLDTSSCGPHTAPKSRNSRRPSERRFHSAGFAKTSHQVCGDGSIVSTLTDSLVMSRGLVYCRSNAGVGDVRDTHDGHGLYDR